MKMPSPTWEATYAADRRKHRHRCRVCCRIIQPGERVLMARVCGGRRRQVTKAIHLDPCATARTPEGTTERDLLAAHGMAYLARCGWPEAQRFLDTSPLFRSGASA